MPKYEWQELVGPPMKVPDDWTPEMLARLLDDPVLGVKLVTRERG